MRTRTVFLLPSDELGWRDVRHALEQMPDVRIVGEGDGDAAGYLATQPPPDLICAATMRDGHATTSLLGTLRRQGWETSRIALFATDFDPCGLAALAPLGIVGYVPWRDVCAWTLPACLTLLLAGTMRVSGAGMHDAVSATPHTVAGSLPEAGTISSRERRILTRLASGLRQNQIASVEGLSLRTVKRSVAELQRKLDAPCLFTLGVRATELGLVASDGDASISRNGLSKHGL